MDWLEYELIVAATWLRGKLGQDGTIPAHEHPKHSLLCECRRCSWSDYKSRKFHRELKRMGDSL